MKVLRLDLEVENVDLFWEEVLSTIVFFETASLIAFPNSTQGFIWSIYIVIRDSSITHIQELNDIANEIFTFLIKYIFIFNWYFMINLMGN